jgi:hypothetical protein
MNTVPRSISQPNEQRTNASFLSFAIPCNIYAVNANHPTAQWLNKPRDCHNDATLVSFAHTHARAPHTDTFKNVNDRLPGIQMYNIGGWLLG